MFSFAGGHYIYDYEEQRTTDVQYGQVVLRKDLIGNTWTPENPKAKYPELRWQGAYDWDWDPKKETDDPLAPEGLGEVGEQQTEDVEKPGEYKFEPTPEAVLDHILPKIVETMVWQALLESAASEHSARMMAMRNASDAAGDMIESLTFTFNQVRQAGITQEIAEISSGKAALE